MKKTYRMQRGIISLIFILIFLIIWALFHIIYPIIIEKVTLYEFSTINSSLFLLPVFVILLGLFIGWSFRNKLWPGFSFALNYYSMTKRLRRHIKNARFEDERKFDNRLVKLPKVKIIFDCNRSRTAGKVLIKNPIKFDKKLEVMRIDSAFNGYVSERKYLSDDCDWYVFEFTPLTHINKLNLKQKMII